MAPFRLVSASVLVVIAVLLSRLRPCADSSELACAGEQLPKARLPSAARLGLDH